jgi:hypothetical protein
VVDALRSDEVAPPGEAAAVATAYWAPAARRRVAEAQAEEDGFPALPAVVAAAQDAAREQHVVLFPDAERCVPEALELVVVKFPDAERCAQKAPVGCWLQCWAAVVGCSHARAALEPGECSPQYSAA